MSIQHFNIGVTYLNSLSSLPFSLGLIGIYCVRNRVCYKYTIQYKMHIVVTIVSFGKWSALLIAGAINPIRKIITPTKINHKSSLEEFLQILPKTLLYKKAIKIESSPIQTIPDTLPHTPSFQFPKANGKSK